MSTNISNNPTKKFDFIGRKGGVVSGNSLADVLGKKEQADLKDKEE